MRDAVLEKLKGILQRDYSLQEIWLFGSRGRGDHKPDSDYDVVAVVGEDSIPDLKMRTETGILIRDELDHKGDVFFETPEGFYNEKDPERFSYKARHEGRRYYP